MTRKSPRIAIIWAVLGDRPARHRASERFVIGYLAEGCESYCFLNPEILSFQPWARFPRSATHGAARLSYCGDFCGTSKCRVLSPKDLRCHLPYEPPMLSALFVNGLESAPSDS